MAEVFKPPQCNEPKVTEAMGAITFAAMGVDTEEGGLDFLSYCQYLALEVEGFLVF